MKNESMSCCNKRSADVQFFLFTPIDDSKTYDIDDGQSMIIMNFLHTSGAFTISIILANAFHKTVTTKKVHEYF